MTEIHTRTAAIDSAYLAVRIGRVMHAIPIKFVEEILPALPIETIATLPAFIRGVVFVRGHLIPILDGAKRLGLPPRPMDQEPQLVCLNIQGRLIGLEIDEAVDLMELPEAGRVPVTELGGAAQFLTAVMDFHGEIVRILDPEKLLLHEETSRLSEAFPPASHG